METETGIGEMVSKSEVLGLDIASWDKPRTTEQLLDFINRREAEIANIDE